MRRWRLITFFVVAIAIIGGVYITRMPTQEDIVIMLPDNDKEFAADYQLLEAAPFTRNILIDLEAAGFQPDLCSNRNSRPFM